MEDAVYFANILRDRACAVCGTDRKATQVLARSECWVCGASLGSGEASLAIRRDGACPMCSDECLALVEQATPPACEACPACGTPWRPPDAARTCRTCAAALDLEAGYVGVWAEGRLTTYCGIACLERHRALSTPFCG